MQIATAIDNKPWVASVWYAHGDDFNLYFISQKFRRHSQELAKNPNIAGAIAYPHTKGSGEKVRGLQFAVTARLTQGDEILTAKKLYETKYELAEHHPIEELQDPNVAYGFYTIKPSMIVLFDEINFPDHPRQEFTL